MIVFTQAVRRICAVLCSDPLLYDIATDSYVQQEKWGISVVLSNIIVIVRTTTVITCSVFRRLSDKTRLSLDTILFSSRTLVLYPPQLGTS